MHEPSGPVLLHVGSAQVVLEAFVIEDAPFLLCALVAVAVVVQSINRYFYSRLLQACSYCPDHSFKSGLTAVPLKTVLMHVYRISGPARSVRRSI